MNIARKICSIRYSHVQRNVHRKYRISSVNYESTKAETQIQEEKFDFEDLKVLERVERRKAAIPPFMKNVFLSIFNRDLLAYPEILNKEESTALDNRVSIIQKTFEDPNSTEDERRDVLSRTGMFGAPVALTDGGLAMNYTESLRYLDVISNDLQLSQELSDHWVCLKLLKIGLTSDNYQKIISDLMTGDSTIGVCVQEKISDRVLQADFRTSAVLNQHGVWVINGEKICKTQTKYVIVLCLTEGMKLKAFLVHPNASGVNYKENYVSFKDTPGTPLTEATEEQLSKTLGMTRLYTANLCRNNLMKSMKASVEYVRTRFISGKPLSQMPTIRSQIGNTLMDIYASESAEYFTAGLLDGYMDPDAELEVAMNFIANHAQSQILKLLAIQGVERPRECLHLLDEMRKLSFRGETLENVNMFIAINGIHHAGRNMANDVKKLRNPLFNPSFILKKIIADRNQERDEPKLDLYLSEDLHPTLKKPSEQLEYCVLRMRYIVESLMSRYGTDVVMASTELNRLAEASTEIYVMAAVLARASRSYCIGLRNGEFEMKLAACFVESTKDHVKKLLLDIAEGEYINLDHFRINFGKTVFENKGLLVEKPTARVFW
ncbi:unnamed protein product [Danaus chrysippus]|uniref:(African queen) hypothetical protein n=1 Tax=Danaus chrysippus TaxID=151541 RepID=A0A8J2W8X3_9NEOP|nr:unnamed protein product [Danaus chrysippus]